MVPDYPATGKRTLQDNGSWLATLRRDGFVSMDGPGMPMPPIGSHGDRIEGERSPLMPPGSLTTVPVVFSGGHLFVNANVRAGELRVEVLRADGSAIDGFGAADCEAVTGDSTRHAIGWRGQLSSLAGTPVCFRFHFDAGELYSFWVSAEASGKSSGYVAAGGPGFASDRDQ